MESKPIDFFTFDSIVIFNFYPVTVLSYVNCNRLFYNEFCCRYYDVNIALVAYSIGVIFICTQELIIQKTIK
jgi:hypothetical protein